MSSRKFKFISPGVFINEIDRSQMPGLPGDIGPALIGRFERGPALKPTQINSFEQFVEVFGKPIPGGQGGDVFRDGNYTAPTYAAYAAQAYLRNNAPVTIIRLVGDTNKDATGESAYAGWKMDNTLPNIAATSNGGAFGLFIAAGSDNYTMTSKILMSGTSGGFSALATKLATSIVLSGAIQTTITGAIGAAGVANSLGYGTGSMPDAGITDTQIAANIVLAVNSGTTAQQAHGFTATNTDNIVTFTAPGPNATVTISGSGLDMASSQINSKFLALTASDGTHQYHSASATRFDADRTPVTGTLAAIWYLDQGTIELSGNTIGIEPHPTSSAGIMLRPVDNNLTFKAVITNNGSTIVEETSFDFNINSPRYIRKRFNTNPTLTNDTIVENTESYFLGETYEGHVKTLITRTSKNEAYGWITPLNAPNNSIPGGDFKFSYSKMSNGQGALAKTGWFISQDLSTNYSSYDPANMTKLFRLVGRLTREDVQRKVKISIKDLRKSSDPTSEYGSFTVAIRDIKDTDAAPVYVEQFNNCNLNPASDNYVAKKLGDKYETWDYDSKKYKEYGDYPNNSDYVRVEVAPDVSDAVTNPVLLPFGAFGPPQYIGYQSSPSGTLLTYHGGGPIATTGTFVTKGLAYAGSRPVDPEGNHIVFTGSASNSPTAPIAFVTNVTFPELRLRISSSEGFVIDPTDAFFGADTTYNSNEFDKSTLDVLRAKPDTVASHVADPGTTENSWVFSLDNVRNANVSSSIDAGDTDDYSGAYATNAVYDVYARNYSMAYNNHSASAGGTNVPTNSATASYENVLEAGFDKFTTCLHGGFDALDITEREPFRNTLLSADGVKETTNYAYNSLSVAIDALRDSERTEFNLVAAPGITNNTLNSKLVRMAESRGDALAIIDPQGGFVPNTEGTDSIEDRIGTVDSTVDNMQQNLKLNSSYGAAYYPWVQIRDNMNGATLWAPASVAAIGALSYSEAVSELWFAPAGFTRGGLSANNAGGLPVIGVRQRLTSKERDKLYENNINPIASFPAEGIVIFGQKTLQTTPSALDRINVRRLTIFLKREISRIAATLLFDQNVQITWNKFRGQAERFLGGVKSGLGLTDYKVILDESTTTPDLIDRNILYAKIFVKPARAIEFIAIDFVITDSGASFDD
jgi:phage tail sheath protein FI